MPDKKRLPIKSSLSRLFYFCRVDYTSVKVTTLRRGSNTVAM